MIPQYTLVKLTPKTREWLVNYEPESPLLLECSFVFMGEIPNMPAHCVIAGRSSGTILSGYHTHDFMEEET